MKTKTKTIPVRQREPLPTGCDAMLSRSQVCFALGAISDRMLTKLIATGRFPAADAHVGDRPRWTLSAVNAALQRFRTGE